MPSNALSPMPTQTAFGGIYNRGRYWEERVAMHQWWSDHLNQLREMATQTDMRSSLVACA